MGGACGGNRTPDLVITNQLLCRLSYTGELVRPAIIPGGLLRGLETRIAEREPLT